MHAWSNVQDKHGIEKWLHPSHEGQVKAIQWDVGCVIRAWRPEPDPVALQLTVIDVSG